jgi:hypothetical protein
MGDICGDNRFEIIAKAKKHLLESTNIDSSEEEMKVLDNFLFRCWQMDWLERYDKPREPLDIPTISTDFVKEQGLPCPNGYIFKDENGNVINAQKIVLEKKKTEYPKTYEECCKVLQYGEILKIYPPSNADVPEYDVLGLFDSLEALRKLHICRDAYWKLYGEEKGLGKPWSPDYDSGVDKFGIIYMNGVVQESNPTTNWERHLNKILDFPTRAMRDAFKENFDADIEICKELL